MTSIPTTELVTLGTAAGPAIRGPENGIASAVVVGDSFYMVDFGLGCVRAAHDAGLRGRDFVAGFVTHLHSDHVVELPGFLLWNWGAPVDGFTREIQILGPGRDEAHPHGRRLAGTSDMVEHTLQAFSYDVDIRVKDEARPDLGRLVRPTEIRTPEYGSAAAQSPFAVYEDDLVRVSAVLVDHPPVRPALAFRFDTEAGSITFSGDTAECSALARLAEGTDILVHEAVNLEFFAGRGFHPTFLNHQSESHTSPEGAGRIATRAGAKRLVLSHLAGVATAEEWEGRARSTFAGAVDVARSGDRFALTPALAQATG
ncbi:MBL fold metallo-hydrolase [Arthrobacter halodurans]|uniref:MBL fold metallo-hydrolase n=1 Tax=Arthrobacter halodurans TaxID=516699 RepID=A0ABV4UKI3_9MICC